MAQPEMLTTLLLTSRAAEDILGTASRLLAGAVPSPAARLASALREANASACAGLLRDEQVRAALAASLEAGCVGEVSDREAAGLVEAVAAVLQERVEAARAAAALLASKLASKGSMPGFKDVLALLPDDQSAGEALQRDWLLWHAVGHEHDPEGLPRPEAGVVCERLALAACAGGGPVAECTLALHVLENLEAYIAWEASLPGSQPPSAQPLGLKGQSVLFPFDAAVAREVAVRRVLGSVLPAEAATVVSSEVVAGTDARAVLQKLAEDARARAVLPMFSAPPAPKEPKEKKESKGGKAEAALASAASGGGAPVCGPLGTFGQAHRRSATQELQWHLLAYRLRPVTTLGAAAKAPLPAEGSAAGAGAAPPAAAAAAASATAAAPTPAGFAGLWAPVGGGLPPGHTEFSWNHAQGAMTGFGATWAPTRGELPPGHTAYSWEKVLASGGATPTAPSTASASASPAVPAPATAAVPAATSKAKAAAPAAVGAGGTPVEGGPEAALCKLDIRCGRIKECGRVPDADSLYLLKVDVGEEQPRQVVSSLVKHYKEEELKDRQVVVYCNIKPGKMRNFESQAMVLAATKDKGAEAEQCELLAPPPGTLEGTRVMCGDLEAGSLSAAQSIKHISKVWNQVQPLLQTNGKCEATFNGTVWTMKEGPVTVGSLSSVGIY